MAAAQPQYLDSSSGAPFVADVGESEALPRRRRRAIPVGAWIAIAAAGAFGVTVSTGTLVAADKEGPSDSAPRPKEDIVVKQVQQILADLGYAPGPVDGAMGSATEGAVKAFQHDRKIAETGRISSELLREIKRVTGRDLADVASR
jgi:hypothetical protein